MNIKTIVYFDLESTGLQDSGRPRISELSFLAVKTEDFLKLHSEIIDDISKKVNIERLPRIINKLTLCVYPMALVTQDASTITGLDNYNLSGQAKFDSCTVKLINSFLYRLPGPICLVAHNGDRFDFPLLKAELDKCGGNMDRNLLCADSYIAMRNILESNNSTKISFSLVNLFKYFYGRTPVSAHGSEADCLSLLKITAAVGSEFFDWIEDNNYKFRHCKPMWQIV